MTSISIIIPTVNEERTLARTFRQLRQLYPMPDELIVVDGGSTDQTISIIQQQIQQQTALADYPPIRLIQSPLARRSYQMNLGVQVATSEYLCFLHADTSLPDDALLVIRETLSQSTIAAGGFISLMRGPLRTRWITSFHNFIKTYYAPLFFRPYLFFFKGARLLFGDQVIFCRRQQFLDCGGYSDDLPIMEEADMLLRIVQFGRIRQVNRVVESSDRRLVKWGFWRANALFLYVGVLWGVGYSAEKLKQLYEDIR
ncbi:TIGR04283 family arsenosugar biosynthesis glycosyltransferase [Spirosoma horti]|uniref:Glycosyltransferase n=1 Tax=Spirosoma pollinicola TaxID=2057025 RepID=A0A2K8Z6B6_9BACT|nr:TIGR04283 family arsenosugar biosynthesis glycosyltransferase [Spirosoma pollinicola]AUD05436.1 glycosyltransferase [Spirosoma pollinicola]RZM30515.1 MAG: glycosyltransferase [Pedobacter sp.]